MCQLLLRYQWDEDLKITIYLGIMVVIVFWWGWGSKCLVDIIRGAPSVFTIHPAAKDHIAFLKVGKYLELDAIQFGADIV